MMHPQHPDTALWRDAEAVPPAIGDRREIDVPHECIEEVLRGEAARGWVMLRMRTRKVTLPPDGLTFRRVAITLEYAEEPVE